MKKLIYGFVGMGIIIVLGMALFVRSFHFDFGPSVKTEVKLVDTGEVFILEDIPALGGDGAKIWYVYPKGSTKRIGQITSYEGFTPESSPTLSVSSAEKGVAEPIMYYDPKTQQLYLPRKPGTE